MASADSYTITRLGRQVALNPYNYFCRINFCRSDLGLSLFDLPPAVPTFAPNLIEELVITNSDGIITLKLRVPGLPVQYTALYVARYGVPTVGKMIWIRTRQQINGWNDLPNRPATSSPRHN